METTRTTFFTRDKKFYKTFFRLMLVVALQNLVAYSVNMLDNIMLGSYSQNALSGAATVNQIFFIVNQLALSIGNALVAICSQYWGKQETGAIRKMTGVALALSVLIGAIVVTACTRIPEQLLRIFTTSPEIIAEGKAYLGLLKWTFLLFMISNLLIAMLRSVEVVKISFVISIVSLITNGCINYTLIFGHFGFPQLGVSGAAIGTVVSRVIEMSINIIGGSRNLYLKDAIKMKKVPFDTTKEMLKRGLPLLCNEILWSISIALISQSYSTRGIIAVAAINITTTVTNFFMIVCYAMGNSISIVVGQQLGAGEIEKAKDYDLKMLFMNFVMCLAIGIVLFNVSSLIPQIYNTSLEVKALASQLLKIAACMLPIISIYYSSYFTMRAGGKTFLTFLFDSGYTFVFTFMSALLLTRLTSLPILTIYLLVQCVDIPKATLGLVLVRKGIWVHNIVSDL